MSFLIGVPLLTLFAMVAHYGVTLTLVALGIAARLYLQFKRKDPQARRKAWIFFGVLMGFWVLWIWIFTMSKVSM